MKLPGMRGHDRDAKADYAPEESHSDPDDAMPALSRHELLTRLGMDDEPEIVGMPSLLMADAESAAA